MKRLLPVLLVVVLAGTGCPKPEDPLTPEELAEGAYGISAITRDGLLLWQLQLGDASITAPSVDEPDEAGGNAVAALIGAQKSLPEAGQTWQDEEGNIYVIREVNYNATTGIALIVVEVSYVLTNPAASSIQTYEIHTNFTELDDSDDRFLGLVMETDYRSGAFEFLEYIDLDRRDGDCDEQVDCDINAGRIGLVLSQIFEFDPHLNELHYEIDVDLSNPQDPNDDLFEREFYGLERVDGLQYSRSYEPSGVIAPGGISDSGQIVETVVFGPTTKLDATGVTQITSWNLQTVTTVQTTTEYDDTSTDDYLVEFFTNGTGVISGSQRNGATITGTVDTVNQRHAMVVSLVDGTTVNVTFQGLENAVLVTRDVVTADGEGSYEGTGSISFDQNGELTLSYNDSRGYVGTGSLEQYGTDFVVRNTEVQTPDSRNVNFDLTISATGEANASFEREGVRGDLEMVPVGGAAGVLERGDVSTNIELDAAGRIQR